MSLFEDIEINEFIFPNSREVRQWLKETKGRLSFSSLKLLNVVLPETLLIKEIQDFNNVNTILKYISIMPRVEKCSFLTPQQEKNIYDCLN